MAGEEPSLIYVIIFLAALTVFCASMWGLGREEANASEYKFYGYNWAVIGSSMSAGIMLIVWLSKYGIATGLWKKDNILVALRSQ